MNFEVLPVSDIWLDFTRFSPIEEAICTVENVFTKWSNEQIGTLEKSRFGFQSIYYFLNYVPENFSQPSTVKKQFIPFPHNTINLIRTIFGIKSPFIYVTNGDEKDNSITKKKVNTLLSIIRPAAQATNFNIPIFIQIQQYRQAEYVGFKLDNSIETFYSSHTESSEIKGFESLQAVRNSYKSSVSSIFKNNEIKDFTSSYRINLKFKEDHMVGKENVHYQSAKFYSFMPNDPVQRFYVSCDLNNINESNENDLPNIMKATNICISIKRICSIYVKSNTEFLIDNMKKCQNHKSWKAILTKMPNASVKAKIMELFSYFEEKDKENSENSNYLIEKSILKASPANSLLSGIVDILVNAKDLFNFASYWTEFVKELRRRTDRHEYIPGVGRTGPDLDHCIYYQKLEMLNLCIKCMVNKNEDSNNMNNSTKSPNKINKILLDGTPMVFPETQDAPVRTEDQIYDSIQLLQKNMDDQRQKAILQSDQLKSDMSAFKRANPTAVFEDFVYWYSPADFDPQTKELSKRMSTEDNVWKEVWANAKSEKNEKSLFDPVAQSEYVLDYFESLAPIEVFGDLIPVILATVYFDVKETTKNVSTIYAVKKSLDIIEGQINHFHTEVEKIEGTLSFDKYVDLSSSIFKVIEEAMLPIHCAISLMQKFNNSTTIVNQLLEFGIHLVVSDDERNVIIALLENIGVDCKSDKLPPEEFIHNRHYIMNGFVEDKGKKLQQRLNVSNYINKYVIASTIQEKI